MKTTDAQAQVRAHRAVLIVDDEPGQRDMLSILLRRDGYGVTAAPGFAAARDEIMNAPAPYGVVLTDLMMPDGSGMDLVSLARRRADATEVIVMTAHSTVEHALDAMRRGAYDFIAKPFSTAELRELVRKAFEKGAIVAENHRLRAQVDRLDKSSEGLLFRSEAMRQILELVGRIASSRTTVLITGESGTGKERIARAIHRASDRASRPLDRKSVV